MYGMAIQGNMLNGTTLCEEFLDYIGDRQPIPQDFPRFIEFLNKYYPSLCGMGVSLWEQDICPLRNESAVLNINIGSLANQFVEYQSIHCERPDTRTPEYIQFRRWLRRLHPEAYPYWATIWAWGVLAD